MWDRFERWLSFTVVISWISCEVWAESKEMVSFNDNHPRRASPDSIDIRKETFIWRKSTSRCRVNNLLKWYKMAKCSTMLHDFFATCDSLFVVQLVAVVQEEKARRLFRPVRGVDLKIAWQIHGTWTQALREFVHHGKWQSPGMSRVACWIKTVSENQWPLANY